MTLSPARETPRRPLHAASRRDRRRGGLAVEVVIALLVGASAFVVHDVTYLLRTPFWLDESWVAISTRAGLAQLPWLTSATPLGWTVMLRAVPGSGPQDTRLLPLSFAALAAIAAYGLGRELLPLDAAAGASRPVRVATGVLVGSGALLAPTMLVRDDLKQYTAEAFVAVLLMALVARLESHWSRARLAWLAGVGAGGLLVANTEVFVAIAAMGGVILAALIRRDVARLRQAVAAAAAMVVGIGALYELLVASHALPGLVSYWDGYYVPTHHGASGALSYIHLRMAQLAPFMGSKHLSIDAVLALAGCAVLVAMRRPALAATVPLTFLLLVGASADRRYPFGDERTSTFLLCMVVVLMAIGAAGIVQAALRFQRGVGVVVLVACLAAWTHAADPSIRSHPLPAEDVRSQVAYLVAHEHPRDVVIVSYSASYGFGYYDRLVHPAFVHIDYATTGFLPEFPSAHRLVQMHNRAASDVAAALAAAEALAAPSVGGDGRIWIVRSHVAPPEGAAWAHDLAASRLTVLHVGPEPLLLYQP